MVFLFPCQPLQHVGTRRHGTSDIKSGRRTNLIVWNHNYEYRAKGVNSWDRGSHYEQEQSVLSPVCLSVTHDYEEEGIARGGQETEKEALVSASWVRIRRIPQESHIVKYMHAYNYIH